MKKSELKEKIFLRFQDYSFLDISLAIDSINQKICQELQNDQRIELRGFGSFSLRKRKPMRGRNPKTGDPIFLPERYVPVFKPSKLMKKTVNEKLIDY